MKKDNILYIRWVCVDEWNYFEKTAYFPPIISQAGMSLLWNVMSLYRLPETDWHNWRGCLGTISWELRAFGKKIHLSKKSQFEGGGGGLNVSAQKNYVLRHVFFFKTVSFPIQDDISN